MRVNEAVKGQHARRKDGSYKQLAKMEQRILSGQFPILIRIGKIITTQHNRERGKG